MPRTIKTTTGMSAAEGALHGFMILMTCGLWYPVYRLRKHQLDRTSKTVIE